MCSPDPPARSPADPAPTTLTRRQRNERTVRALRTAARSKSPGRREALLDYAVRLNVPLAHDVAIRYLHPGLDNDAILKVAHDALARAVRNFEPDQDQEFVAFAVREIQREIAEHGSHTWAVPGATGWTPGT